MTIKMVSEEEAEQHPDAPETEEEVAELWRQIRLAKTENDGEE